jgi:hypothetical protein
MVFEYELQATGASSLEEMHEKFSSQKINKANLLQEVKDAEKRLDAAKLSHQKHEITFQELKSSGAGGGAAFTEQSKETNDEYVGIKNRGVSLVNIRG